MKFQTWKYGALILPVLYFIYDYYLAKQLGTSADQINALSNSLILFILILLIARKANIKQFLDIIWFFVFSLYLMILHYLVTYLYIGNFIKGQLTAHPHLQFQSINLVPFATIEATFNQIDPNFSVTIQVIGNILMLAPLAFFLLYFQLTKKAGKTFLWIVAVAIGIECIQFLQTTFASMYQLMPANSHRSADIDDIILNSCSGLLGILAAYLIPKVRKRMGRK